MRRAAFTAFAVMALGACNAILGIGAPNVVDESDASPEAAEGSPDGVTPPNPADANDAAPNLAPNGDFEKGTCAPFDSNPPPTIDTTTAAHSGKTSCKVCGATGGYGLVLTLLSKDVSLAAGHQYYASAYVRQAPGGDVATDVELDLTVYENLQPRDKSTVLASIAGPLSGTWTKVEAQLDIADSVGTELDLSILSSVDAGGACFLVDDVVLQLTK
jgi:hypothetical protein